MLYEVITVGQNLQAFEGVAELFALRGYTAAFPDEVGEYAAEILVENRITSYNVCYTKLLRG